MTNQRILLSIVLAGFLALTVVAIMENGYAGFFELALANSATRLLSVDLCITLTLITVWMYVDARERGASFLPYVVLTLAFGAAGPLLYLIRRPARQVS